MHDEIRDLTIEVYEGDYDLDPKVEDLIMKMMKIIKEMNDNIEFLEGGS